MKNFIGKITAALAVAVFAVVGFGAAPAQASTVYGCPDNYVCVYDGTNYGTWHWGRQSLANLEADGCLSVDMWVDMGGSGDFNNTVSSIIVNATGYSGSSTFKKIHFYMNAGCTGTPVPYVYLNDGLTLDADLSNGAFGVGTNWSNALTSIGWG